MKTGINDHTGTLVPPELSIYDRTSIVGRQDRAFHYPRHERKRITRAQDGCPQCFGVDERCGVASDGDEAWNWRRCPHAFYAPDYFAFEDVVDGYDPRLPVVNLGQLDEVRNAFNGDGDGRRARAVALRMEDEARAAGGVVIDSLPLPGTAAAMGN